MKLKYKIISITIWTSSTGAALLNRSPLLNRSFLKLGRSMRVMLRILLQRCMLPKELESIGSQEASWNQPSRLREWKRSFKREHKIYQTFKVLWKTYKKKISLWEGWSIGTKIEGWLTWHKFLHKQVIHWLRIHCLRRHKNY